MKITLIGAGNLATNLAFALVEAGHEIRQIYSRTDASAKELAEKAGVRAFTSQISAINKDSDIYIVSITDKALSETAPRLVEGREQALWLHTAGSMPMDILTCRRRGVLYPMQTFSKQKRVSFRAIPIFIESAEAEDLRLLKKLAQSLSDSVYELSSQERPYLHLAAVFCCNFANHCSTLAARLLEKHGIPFSVMLPLIDETTQKLHTLPPAEAQTGPASRGDENVMGKHLHILQSEGETTLANIYQLMSQSIRQSAPPHEPNPRTT